MSEGPDLYTDIAYAVADQIATITLNRPAARNGYTLKMSFELADAFERADADPDVRVVIFTGAGETFCVGADLAGGGMWDVEEALANPDTWQEPAGRCTRAIFAMNKPVIAALRGAAVGAGSTIIMACDYRLASTDSRFGFVFVRRGIVPEGGSTWFLPRLVGHGKAADWMLSGRVFGVDEAFAAGLVTSVHEPSEVLGAAQALASELITNTAPVAAANIRQMLFHVAAQDSPDLAHNVESRLVADMPQNPDAIEGIMSFLQKRRPVFTGDVAKDIPSWLPWRSPDASS